MVRSLPADRTPPGAPGPRGEAGQAPADIEGDGRPGQPPPWDAVGRVETQASVGDGPWDDAEDVRFASSGLGQPPPWDAVGRVETQASVGDDPWDDAEDLRFASSGPGPGEASPGTPQVLSRERAGHDVLAGGESTPRSWRRLDAFLGGAGGLSWVAIGGVLTAELRIALDQVYGAGGTILAGLMAAAVVGGGKVLADRLDRRLRGVQSPDTRIDELEMTVAELQREFSEDDAVVDQHAQDRGRDGPRPVKSGSRRGG